LRTDLHGRSGREDGAAGDRHAMRMPCVLARADFAVEPFATVKSRHRRSDAVEHRHAPAREDGAADDAVRMPCVLAQADFAVEILATVNSRHRHSDGAEHRRVPDREHGSQRIFPIGSMALQTMPCACRVFSHRPILR
jgi:hypothetical protein